MARIMRKAGKIYRGLLYAHLPPFASNILITNKRMIYNICVLLFTFPPLNIRACCFGAARFDLYPVAFLLAFSVKVPRDNLRMRSVFTPRLRQCTSNTHPINTPASPKDQRAGNSEEKHQSLARATQINTNQHHECLNLRTTD